MKKVSIELKSIKGISQMNVSGQIKAEIPPDVAK